MSDDLRDAIAQLLCADDNFNWAGESWDVCGEPVQDWWRRKGDAVLAMPEIVDMLALRRRVDDVLSYIVDCYLADIPVRPEWIEKILRA